MRAQLLKHWERLHASFWFIPSIMALAAVGLAFSSVSLDQTLDRRWLRTVDWVYNGGAEGASAVLQTIAGSMITIAGVVFSLTLVALSLASSQFGPRLLRNFMRDRSNQLVLGTFIATFLYCLLVLRTVRREGPDPFVPHLSVTLGVVFALASLWVLIYFIHHVSVSIQADEVIAHVNAECEETMRRLFPEHLGAEGDSAGDEPPALSGHALVVSAHGDGYLQIVDEEALMQFAQETDSLLRLQRRPGHYIMHGSALLSVEAARHPDEQAAARLRAAFVLGAQRTSSQDVEFAILELVEIGVRALSPGVNDPFTAIACIDRLGSILSRLAQRRFPQPCRYDSQRRLRIVARPDTYAGLVDAAFNQLRQYGRTSAAVNLRLLEAIAMIAPAVRRNADRAALQRQADMIARGAAEALPEAEDRRAVQVRHLAVRQALAQPCAGSARQA